MATFDGPNLLITLDALPSPNTGAQSINVQDDLYEQWKQWAQLPGNLGYPPAFRTIGGDPLTPGVEAGAYFFLRNDLGWRIQSSAETQTINYSGNLVGDDSSLPIIIQTPGETVLHLGLQPVTQRVDEILTQSQLGLYDGSVHLDTSGGGAPGTAYPLGTSFAPVDNWSDAVTILQANNFRKLFIDGAVVAASAVDDLTIFGISQDASLDLGGQLYTDAALQNINFFGSMSGELVAANSTVSGAVTGFLGTMNNCILESSVQLVPGVNRFYNCKSGVSGTGSPIIDGNGQSGIDLTVRAFDGGLRISNFTVGDTIATLSFNVGRLNIDASVTNFGIAEVRGTVEINNESALGVGPISSPPFNQFNTDGAIQGSDIAMIKAFTAGRVDFAPAASPDNGTIIVTAYDDNGNVLRQLLLDETAGAENRTVV